MGKTTISWTATIDKNGVWHQGYSFNPWVGCTKVSAACDFCYAESWAKRSGHPELWTGDRRRTTAANWQGPIKWNAAAGKAGLRKRVFCASLADVFDNQVPEKWRHDLWHRIEQTPHLDWMLLTKRPQNILKMLPDPATGVKPWDIGWPNVWLGTTAENQEEYNRRWAILQRINARVRFVSYEPALGPLRRLQLQPCENIPDWIICGGESGGRARSMDLQWARDLRDICRNWVNIAFFMKQMGSNPVTHIDEQRRWVMRDRAGADPAEWPADLRIQEFPNV